MAAFDLISSIALEGISPSPALASQMASSTSSQARYLFSSVQTCPMRGLV